MRLFSREQDKNQTVSRVSKRASKMTTPDLVAWLDALVLNLGQTFDKWSRDHTEIEDMDMVIEAINTLWEELKRRD
jgi:hypothetical protein